MQTPSKSEAEAWLEEAGHYNQRNSQQNRSSDEEEQENENLTGNEEEVLEDSDEREEYNEEEEDMEDVEEQEEIEEDSQEQQEEGGDEDEEEDDLEEVQEIQQQENFTEDKEHEEGVVGERRRGHKPSKSQLPYGSPVKRAHTANDSRRQTSRALASQREKSPFDTTGKYTSDREMFKRLTGQSLSPTRSPEEFLGYYEKFCKGFLLKKEEELEKKRRQKEEDELAQLQDKPTLISRPQVKPYVPLLERTPLLNARREQEIEKIKREKEEKEQREFEELTFKPKINPKSKNLAASPTRERLLNVYLRTKYQFSQSPLTQRKVDRDAFQPKINPNSRNIVQAMRDNASKDVVERLYHRADLGRAKKTELAKQLTPKFTPSLNKNTRKIAKQIEANYHNEQNDTKRDKRKRSEPESNRTSSQLHGREESHLEQASDLELLDILKQFNSMLEQKNEGPINLQQLSTLMSSYAGKKKIGGDSSKKEQEYEHAEEDEEEEEYEGQGLHEQIVQREAHTDRPVKNYRAIPVNEEDSNPMFNIEKNLMHIQDSLQDLKENGGSQASSRSKIKKSRQHTDYNEQEHTEREESEVVVQSKNSVGTRKKSASHAASERNTPAKSQKSLSHVSPSKHDVQKSLSHVTPSKHDVNELEESKHNLAPASIKSVQKEQKEDYSSPDAAKITKKRAQTTTKKTNKKIKTYTDQSPRFDNESHNQIKSLKDARSLNEMFSHTVGSKNSLEGWNSHFEVQDQIVEGYDSTRDYHQEGKAKGHAVEHSFGGNQRNSANEIRQEDQRNSANEIRQEDQNYRSNHPAETSKPKSGFVKKTNVDRVKEKDQEKWRSSPHIKDQEKEKGEEEYERGKASSHAHITYAKNQGSQNSIVSGSVKKDSHSQKSSSKEKRGRDQEEKKHRNSTTSSKGKDQSKKSVNLDDKTSKAGSASKVGSEYHQDDRSNRPKSGKGSRKVSFDNKPASDSRRSSIYEEEEQHNNLAGSQTKGSHSGYKKGSHEQQHGQGHLSTFANKYSNKRQEQEHQHRAAEDDDEVHSSIHGTPKVRSGDYMSFSANTLDQQPSFDDHQPPQNERKLTDEYESDGNKAYTHTSKGNNRLSVRDSPSKQRAAHFEVVTTETIQIEPQSAPKFSYSMDGSDKAITTASSSGLKAMAEQIVKKFKAYDAQIKQTAREYKMSVSPPRTASPSPEHHDNVHELEPKKEKEHHREHKEHKVFKSVEKNSGTAKSSRNEIRQSRNSIPGSLSSVQSGVDRRIGKK